MKDSLGFTGARGNPSDRQKKWLLSHVIESVVETKEIKRVHHGCCIGADEFFHKCAKSVVDMGLEQIVCHPPSDRSREMETDEWSLQNCLWYPRKPYLIRNVDIVHGSTRLVALPDRPETTRGSGTWYTVHEAMASKRHVTICWPDGRVDQRPPGEYKIKNLKRRQ